MIHKHSPILEHLEARLLMSSTTLLANLMSDAQQVQLPPAGQVEVNGDFGAGTWQVYQLTAGARGRLSMGLTADAGIDPSLAIFNSRGRRVNAVRAQSQLGMSIKAGGSVFVLASGDVNADRYTLTLNSQAVDDYGDTAATAGQIRLNLRGNGRAGGAINYGQDVDLLSFVATQTGHLTAQMWARGWSNQMTPALTVYNAEGQAVSADQQSSRVSFDVQRGNTYYIRSASDNQLPGRYTIQIRTEVPPPAMEHTADQTGRECTPVSFQVNGLPRNGERLALSAADLPTGASFNASTGVFSWTPNYGQAGSYHVVFSVSDGLKSSSQAVLISIGGVNLAPIMNAIENHAVDEGQLLQFVVGATDPDGDPVTYSAAGLPSGATLDAYTGQFSWTPNYGQFGSYELTFSASDGSLSGSSAIIITVQTDVVVGAPVLDLIGHRIVLPGATLEFTIHATDPNGAPLTYSAQNLPTGATFDPTSATFTWTPASAQTGPFPGIRFIASDGGAASYEDITITPNLNSLGIGATNAYYIDKDMDGYGVGSPLGPDADDSDPIVNTSDSMLAKYGTLNTFLEHLGYGSSRVLFIAPDGNDSTGTVNDISSPYASWAKVRTLLQPGDTVIYRSGTYHEEISMQWPSLNGTDGNRITIMAYPGAKATIVAAYGARLMESSHIVIDGLVFDGTELGPWVASWGLSGGFLTDVTLKNLEVRNHYTGMLFMQGLNDFVIEGSVIHDNYAEHGIYLGAREFPNTNITIRSNIIYHNTRNGIQHNGRVTNMVIEGNIIHSNVMAGISLLEGMSYSVIRDNLIFNNNKQGILIVNYDEPPSILPYDQAHNVIEHNTIWVGKYKYEGSGTEPSDHAAILLSNDSAGQVGSLDDNIFRNNVLVTYNGPLFWFAQQNYADTTVINNNLLYRAGGDARIMQYGADTYDMAGFNAFSPLFQGNIFAEAVFRDVSVDYNMTPERFNFELLQ